MLNQKATGSAFLQKLAVFYIVIWTISPFMEIDMIWRLLALGCAVVWFAFELEGTSYLGRTQLFAVCFAVAVVLIAYMETGSAKGIIRQIALYIIVICFLMNYYYRNRWHELSGLVPLVLILLIIYNTRTVQALLTDPTLARKIVRNDEEIYAYLRKGIGGYSLIYPQVVIFPAIFAWIRKAFRHHKVFFTIGAVWLVSYVLLLANAGYATAIAASVIGLALLLFYRGKNAVPAVLIALGLFVAVMMMIVNVDSFRNFLLTTFEGTSVEKKINDLMLSAESGAAEGSIYARIKAYTGSFDTILQYPLIGGLWNASGGGHSAILDIFAKYGVLGGYIYVTMLTSVPKYYKECYPSSNIRAIANATLVCILFVAVLDSCTYAFFGMILIVQPLLYEDIMKWSGRQYENSMDGESDSHGISQRTEY